MLLVGCSMAVIGENLRRLRKAKGMSQAKLAELSGVSQQLISQIENGVNERTLELPSLARALGCGIDELDPNYIDTGTAKDPEALLRSIALSMGAEERDLDRIVRVFIAAIDAPGEVQSEQNPSDDQSQPASPRRVVVPLRRPPLPSGA